jgi:protein DGCR14
VTQSLPLGPPESMTPRVRGYGFVSSMPTPRPDSLAAGLSSEESKNELMTWGTIESTPIASRNSDDFDVSKEPDGSTGAFRISDTPKREELAHKMATKAGKSIRDRLNGARSGKTKNESLRKQALLRALTPKGGMTPTRVDLLSPAARNLLSRTGGLGQLKKDGRKRVFDEIEGSPLGTPATIDAKAKEVEERERLKRMRWTPRE